MFDFDNVYSLQKLKRGIFFDYFNSSNFPLAVYQLSCLSTDLFVCSTFVCLGDKATAKFVSSTKIRLFIYDGAG